MKNHPSRRKALYAGKKNLIAKNIGQGPGSFLFLLLLTIVLVAILAFSFSFFLSWVFRLDGASSEQSFPALLSINIAVLEGVVGLVSVWLVIRQLKSEEKTEEKENRVKVAEFIFKYNQEFIDSPKLTRIESYLESTLVTNTPPEFSSLTQTPQIRQQAVNYLVYLEGFASCILEQVMELDSVDDLFAYRFFLAADHPEVQRLELLEFSTYYKGIFKLYRLWLWYRITHSPGGVKEENSCIADFCRNVWDIRTKAKPEIIPSACTALDLQPEYEAVAQTLERRSMPDSRKIDAWFLPAGKEAGRMEIQSDGSIMIAIREKTREYDSEYVCFETLVFLLKEYVKEYNPSREQIDRLRLCGTRKGKEYVGEVFGKENTDLVREMMKTIADQSALKISLVCRQLGVSEVLSSRWKEKIAGLIYDTDPFIYPAMFGKREDAVVLLSALIGRDSLYKNERFYIAESGDDVVGLLLWIEGAVQWSPELLETLAREKQICLPDTFPLAVSEYFSERYDKQNNEGTISIVNLCVDTECRGMQVGSRLLSSFIADHSSQDMKLCVLRDNAAAIRLYMNKGFLTEGVYDGFSVSPPRPKCLEMTRPGQ